MAESVAADYVSQLSSAGSRPPKRIGEALPELLMGVFRRLGEVTL